MPYLLKLISTLKIYEIHGTLRYDDPIKIDDNAPQGLPVKKFFYILIDRLISDNISKNYGDPS